MSAEQDPNRAVDAFVGAIRNLASDDNYKVIADVFRDVQNLKTENARLASSSRDVLEEYRKFRNELEAKETELMNERTQLQRSIEIKDAQIQDLEAANNKLDVNFQKSRRKLDEESQKCLELADKRKELETTASNLKLSLDEKSKLLSGLEGIRSEMDSELAEAKGNLDLRIAELVSLQGAKKDAEDQLADMKASVDENIKQLKTIEEAKDIVDAQLATANLELEGKTRENEELTAARDKLAAELAEASSKLSETSKEIDELSNLRSSLDTQLAELTTRMDGQAQELNDLVQAKAGLNSALVDANAALEDKTMETEELTLQLAESKVNYENKAAQVQDLTSQLADVNGKFEAGSRELQELFEVKASVDAQLAETKAQLEGEQAAKTAAEDGLKTATENLQKEADKTSILLDEVAHLRQTISDKNEEVDKLKSEVAEGNNSLSQAQSSVKKLENLAQALERELTAKTDRLDKIDTYQLKLKHEPEETYVEILDTIWVSILDLAEHHFSQDLDPAVLRDPSCWANLRSSEYLKHLAVRLPLPQSNTAAAKQMRIAAVLAVLSRALARHVFRPSYALDSGSADTDAVLTTLLRGLEAASPDHERHLRGALLAALTPDKVARASRRRAAAVVREVSFLVQHLLSALQYEAFCEGLEACAALACAQWARVQGAAMKIEPYFGPPFDDFDWQVLMLPDRFSDGRPGSGSTLGLDAGSDTIGGSSRSLPQAVAAQDAVSSPSPSASVVRDDDASTIAESVRSVVDPADIMVVLWPSMCAVEGGELVSITQGLVMAKEQAATAFEEEGRRRPWLNGKRARSMSQSKNGMTGNSHSGKAILAQAKKERDGSASTGSRNGSRNGSVAADD
ncbi:hypothetical protein J7T55_013252 [Diaporthe amygdali]|uniref:uncharacterized protein n=1 Tax=Phomopsis amygdali TaxID=1214568 RepID=UPI0022FDD97E|nr:uncharacterized protein J7T55_013252 [Diaporthe amygdali]KAJ0119017.1 hypothetical protein J7T55_013252 [Diaporthe amygdali]